MRTLFLMVAVVWPVCGTAAAQSLKEAVAPLIEASCLHCHDSGTETSLNFESMGHDLSDTATFRTWERVFDRVRRGEMPPQTEDRPDPKHQEVALDSLQADLLDASRSRQQKVGRVPTRRLTKLEFGYTLQDLLLIDGDFTHGIPDEVESGSFDTVGANQRISAVHLESYLQAAGEAIRQAIKLGSNPYRVASTDYTWLEEWHDKPLQLGGSVTRKLNFGDGIALFTDIDYLTQFQFDSRNAFARATTAGIYRLSARVAAYQSKSPVAAKMIVKDSTGAARLVKSADVEPGDPQEISVETYLRPGDTPYLTFEMEGEDPGGGVYAAGGAQNYRGRGLAILSQKVEGPLFDSWPPTSTLRLLEGLVITPTGGSEGGPFQVEAPEAPLRPISGIVKRFAPRAFRRPVTKDELTPFIDLAKPAIEEGREFLDVAPIPLRSMLSSPQFLLFGGQPGELDDHALASRLSYFVWKSMPDEELFELARQGKLREPDVLAGQVDRMLDDKKASRFVRDFLGQWLRLNKVNATTPDDGLYPEFDELLSNAIPRESLLFFSELIKEDLSLLNLIDSDFTFVNRRLATHYGLADVKGQHFRKVVLPRDNLRGGVLTQAAILKTTANGTTTSPVMRGNFVLTNLLGTPPPPPPPDVGSIEPDTRGKTTIREILASHREIESCNKCHKVIDPPGFALESFDPIGGFRTRYRASGGERTFGDFTQKLPPRQGPPVDPSGVTDDGKAFTGIKEFKQHLLAQKEQIARNFISQLVAYSTGGEIQFADRDQVEEILNQTRDADFPIRSIIHRVVQSRLFRNK